MQRQAVKWHLSRWTWALSSNVHERKKVELQHPHMLNLACLVDSLRIIVTIAPTLRERLAP